jgi:peptidyl-prolyl cis-trans isomerase SurA
MTMKHLITTCRGFLAAIALAVLAATMLPSTGHAQLIAVMVNGDPITNFDIEQRMKLIMLSTHKPAVRQDVIKELIDERLKLQLVKRYGMEGVDNEVSTAFDNMARRMKLTTPQFVEQIGKSGVLPGTLKSRMKAEIIWTQIIRGKYQASFQVINDKDILAKMEANKAEASEATVGTDYTLRPILFVVPRRSAQAVIEGRMKEAEALRARFQGCDDGIRSARALRDVAVRAPVVKSSSDLPAQLREVLDKTEVGKLTSPEVTAQGIEVFALCDKKQSKADNTVGKKEARDALYNATFQRHSKEYMSELRSQAMIEYR